MPRSPSYSRGDSYSPAQLAHQWDRAPALVQRLFREGNLVVDDRGMVTNAALQAFYRDHGAERL